MLLELKGISDFTDYFVIANGSSERMLGSLAKSVDEGIKQAHGLDPKIEGQPESGWLLLDYAYVVVHLLSPERREYYQLEVLWNKGKVILRLQ